MTKRLLPALLALCMALALLPGTALAEYYGDAMKGGAQAVYQALEKNRQAAQDNGTAVAGTITEKGTIAAMVERRDALMEAAETASFLFHYDHPELFWLRSEVQMTCSIEGFPNQAVLTADVTIPCSASWVNGRSIAADQAAVDKVVGEIVAEAKKASTPAEQLRYVHNWLTRNNAYNRTAANTAGYINTNSTPWSAISALDSSLSPVCEGYARAFKLICNALDIECVLVSGKAGGGDHMWNYVKLDGKWYAVDVTYDDPVVNGKDTSGTEAYFLVGGNTKIEGKTFQTSHVPDEKMAAYYPQLSDSKF